MNQDQIHIKDLQIKAIIGVYPHERINEQTVIVNVTLFTDHRLAAESNQLEDAVDYAALTQKIVALVTNEQFKLVERAASEITKLCLADSRITRAVVTVDKPDAISATRSVGVTVDRSR